MPMARGQDGVDRDLHVAVGAVLDAHRHGESRSELSMNLALCGACTDRSPAHQIGIELAERSIQKLRAGRQTQLRNIREKPARRPESLVDVVRTVEVRIVDESFPADGRARLLEINA